MVVVGKGSQLLVWGKWKCRTRTDLDTDADADMEMIMDVERVVTSVCVESIATKQTGEEYFCIR